MGLDMYLTRKIYVAAKWEHRNVTGSIDISINRKKVKIDFKKIGEITEDVGYWRKANQIHKWFVDNVQDGKDNCGEYDVTLEQCKKLLSICHEVKDKCVLKPAMIINGHTASPESDGEWVPNFEDGKTIVNPEIAHNLLPTQPGCFFGSTDYDQYYMSDIYNTIEILTPLIENWDKSDTIIYSSSW
jgi:hypothetical protein